MQNMLLIDSTETVINVIVVGDAAEYEPPPGYSVEPRVGAEWIGWRRVDGVWQPPLGDVATND